MGLQFRGQLLTPGADFNPDNLPRPAVLIECAGSVRIKEGRSKYCFRCLWLLWRFDFETLEWIEVMRTQCDNATWTEYFAPIALQLLRPAPDGREALRAARPISTRLIDQLRAEFREMLSEVACCVLADLDNFIAGEIVARTRELQPVRKPMGKEAVWPRLGAHEGSEPGKLQAVRRMGQ
jgi:hypothetical protein